MIFLNLNILKVFQLFTVRCRLFVSAQGNYHLVVDETSNRCLTFGYNAADLALIPLIIGQVMH